MTVYCSECGEIIEPGADFCYRCGALRSRAFEMDESGNLTPVDRNTARLCPNCGYTNTYNDTVCGSCGAQLPSLYARRSPRRLTRGDFVKIALGVLLGAAGICGVGQILYRRFASGLMYLVLSIIILYVELSMGYSGSIRFLALRLLGLFIFFRSSFDLLRIAYYETPSKGGDN